MKTKNKLLVRLTAPVFLAALLGLGSPGHAQTPSIDWYTVDGGGGYSESNGVILRGTIGQPDAGVLRPRPPGGAYALSGGFWSLFDTALPSFGSYRLCFRDGVVYLPGNPYYNTILVQWPDAGLKLQAAGELVASPANTVWADVNPASYASVSGEANPDLCGDSFSTFVWTILQKRTAQSTHPIGFQPSVIPLVPALFSSPLDGPQAGVFDTPGNGSGDYRLSTPDGTFYFLALRIKFDGLGSGVTGVHVHGPAGPGATNGVVFNLGGASGATNGVYTANQILTAGGGYTLARRLDQLRSGLWYVDVHTTSHPGGEIRGQLYLKQQLFRAVPQ